MWSFSRISSRRPARAALLAPFVLMLTLAGCGFRPLYAPAGSERSYAADQLATVHIEPLPDRTGQKLHNFLRDRLNPKGQPTKPLYRLQVSLKRRNENLAFREDETATRSNIILDASFALLGVGDNQVRYSGRVSSIQSYNILVSQYPTITAEADALERGLLEISEDIKLRLSVYFASLENQDL